MTSDAADAGLTADLLAMLDADPHGWALARAVREGGDIIDFELVYMNRAGSRFLGRAPEVLVGRTYRELWPETVTDGTLPLYSQVVQDRVAMVRTVYYDRASVAGHFEFRVGPYGDGFLARFVDLTKLTVGPQTEGGARLYEALDAALRRVHAASRVTRRRRRHRGLHLRVRQPDRRQAGRAHRLRRSSGEKLVRCLPGGWSTACSTGTGRWPRAASPGSSSSTSPASGQVWEIKIVRVEMGFVAVSYREITEQIGQQGQLERAAEQARAAAARTTHLQAVTAALQAVTAAFVAANTPEEVYAAMGT